MTWKVEDFLNESAFSLIDRRALPRVRPTIKVWAAVENQTRRETLGLAEIADFSGLGLALRGLSLEMATIGDRLWVTLVADSGIIPLRATLVHIGPDGRVGLRVEAPNAPGQHFLLRLYTRAAQATTAA